MDNTDNSANPFQPTDGNSAAFLDNQANPAPAQLNSTSITWRAQDFVENPKDRNWYTALALVVVIIAAALYLLLKDVLSAVVILACGGILGYVGSRKSQQIDYKLDNTGVTIGTRFHSLDDFRSFAKVVESGHNSVVFMPLKRFSPLTSIYYPAEQEDQIINLLANTLPYEEHRLDPVDRLMQRIHF